MKKIGTFFISGVVISMLVLGLTSQMVVAKSLFHTIMKYPTPQPLPQPPKTFTTWINPLDFVPSDPTITTSLDFNPGVGTGLLIGSTATGESKGVEKGIQVPPGFLISGVRVCYELSNAASYISSISLSQLQNPPIASTLLLNDERNLTLKGPICVDSATLSTPADPSEGMIRLGFGVNFASDKDLIVILAVGLHLVLDPEGPIEHSHIYLTGKGVGHNNTEAITSEPIFSPEPSPK